MVLPSTGRVCMRAVSIPSGQSAGGTVVIGCWRLVVGGWSGARADADAAKRATGAIGWPGAIGIVALARAWAEARRRRSGSRARAAVGGRGGLRGRDRTGQVPLVWVRLRRAEVVEAEQVSIVPRHK